MGAFEGLAKKIEEVQTEAARLAEIHGPREDLLWALVRAAEAWASENEARAAGGRSPLPLELAEGFVGLVLEATIGRQHEGTDRDKVRAAFVALGKARTVEQRNHTATAERVLRDTERLRAALRGESRRPDVLREPATQAEAAAAP